jgi:hypothetical protein
MTIGSDKAARPFLCTDNPETAIAVGPSGSPAWKGSVEIRKRKYLL